MQSRSWLLLVKFLTITVAAVVLADVVALTIRARATPAPSTQPIAPVAAASAAPTLSEPQAIEQARVLLGTHSDITKEEPAPGAAETGAPDASGTPSAAEASVPDPSAQMTLVGTVVSPGASIAIMVSEGSERVLHEGDQVGNPAFRVAEIRDTSVILDMGGVRRTLWMPSFQPAAGGSGGGLLPPPPAPVAAPPPSSTEPSAPGKAIIPRAERDKVMSDLPSTLADLRILPNKKNGAEYGSRVVFLKAGSFLSRVGLAQDDILLSVNGSPVSNAEQGLQVFQSFQHEERIVMKIDRGGKLIQQEVEFR